MEVTVYSPSCVQLSDESSYSREPPRPKSRRQEGYSEKFDFKTLFYDIFTCDGDLALVGPPLFNLSSATDELQFSINGKKVDSFDIELKDIDRTQNSYIVGVRKYLKNSGDNYLEISGLAESWQLKIKPSQSSKYKDRRILATTQKNNRYEWIVDWILYYSQIHNVDTVIIYDNGSTEYSVENLQARLNNEQKIAKLKEIVIVSWAYPYGPLAGVWAGDKSIKSDSDFCQISMFDHCKKMFAEQSELFVNADIDELLICRDGLPISDYMSRINKPFVKYSGRWIEAYQSNKRIREDDDLPRFSDFYYYNTKKPSCTPKWTIKPKYFNNKALQWKTHHVVGLPYDLDDGLTHRHFRGISNNWKFQRTEKEKVGKNYQVDYPLVHVLNEVYKNQSLSSEDMKLEEIKKREYLIEGFHKSIKFSAAVSGCLLRQEWHPCESIAYYFFKDDIDLIFEVSLSINDEVCLHITSENSLPKLTNYFSAKADKNNVRIYKGKFLVFTAPATTIADSINELSCVIDYYVNLILKPGLNFSRKHDLWFLGEKLLEKIRSYENTSVRLVCEPNAIKLNVSHKEEVFELKVTFSSFSTAKVTCYSKRKEFIDDLTKSFKPKKVHSKNRVTLQFIPATGSESKFRDDVFELIDVFMARVFV